MSYIHGLGQKTVRQSGELKVQQKEIAQWGADGGCSGKRHDWIINRSVGRRVLGDHRGGGDWRRCP